MCVNAQKIGVTNDILFTVSISPYLICMWWECRFAIESVDMALYAPSVRTKTSGFQYAHIY